MGGRFLGSLAAGAVLCALAAAPARSYDAYDRWNTTATNSSTGPRGTPITVTWSFVPDETLLPTEPGAPPSPKSNLIAFFDLYFGAGPGGADLTQRPWFTQFDQSFSRLAALSGVTYVYEPNDDGASMSSASSRRGVLGVRGDVRVSAKSYPTEPTYLATNFFPDYADMMLNSDQNQRLPNPANNYGWLRNTLMHEFMHGLGLNHVGSSDSLILMNGTLNGLALDGPQMDDVRGLHHLYGDALEKNGGNDTAATATPLGALSLGGSLVRGTLGDTMSVTPGQVDFVSIDDATDVDYFSFSLNQPLAVTLNLTPKGATYHASTTSTTEILINAQAMSNLALDLYDATSGLQIGPTANQNGLGGGESIARELNPGTYRARVSGAQSEVQLYQLAVLGVAIPAEQLTWFGALGGGVWDVAGTANFQNSTAADVFRNGDEVTFGQAVATKSVTIAGPVAPATMTVNAAGDYTFSGAGIAVNQLVISGGGTATLANSGNALNAINVQSGKLRISGSGNAPIGGSVRVAPGAALDLVGPQALAASSQFTGGGTVSGDVTMPGTIAPGEPLGTLTFADDLTLTSSSVIALELGGEVAGTQFDVINVLSGAALNGALSVALFNGFQPSAGDSFTVLTIGGTRTGFFVTESLPPLGSGLMWHTTYAPHEVVLSISAAVSHAAADFNEDGFVDGADLDVWRQGFGAESGATHTQGDANGDTAVNGLDFLAWQRGLFHPSTLANTSPVPEPAGWAIAVAAAITLTARGRNSKRTCS